MKEGTIGEERLNEILTRLRGVSCVIANNLNLSDDDKEDLYGEMVLAFFRFLKKIEHKELSYVIKTCKNCVLKKLYEGTSVDSKPRPGVSFVDWEKIYDNLVDLRNPREIAINRVIIDRIKEILTDREKEVFALWKEGYTQEEIGKILHISQPRVSNIVKEIKAKAQQFKRMWDFLQSG